MFSMCGLLCRFLRGWRQSEAVGIMVQAATLKDASLIVESIGSCSKPSPDEWENEQSLFCQPLCQRQDTRHKQLLWRDNSKQATVLAPKEKVDLTRWTKFSSKTSPQEPYCEDCLHTAPVTSTEKNPGVRAHDASSTNHSTPSSRKSSECSDCENVITVLLEASHRHSEEESLFGYNVMVEHLAEPFAWKVHDVFGIVIYTTPTKLVSMIHAFFNNALVIDEDLNIRKILTVDLEGEPSCLMDPPTISESVTPGLWSQSKNSHTQTEIERAAFPEASEHMSSSIPNLSGVGFPFSSKGIPLSSSFTSSPFRRPPSGTTPSFSPSTRTFGTQGKSVTSPGNDSCSASPLMEEEESELPSDRDLETWEIPPNVLVYTGNNLQYFEDVRDTLDNAFLKNRYVIYHMSDELAFKSPWKYNTSLLVMCGDVPTHVSTEFIRYLLTGGKVLSICSDFLNVAVPLFGMVEVQEASVISMSYGKWKNVQLLHHQHCFHSSPKHNRSSKHTDNNAASSGSAVSVEPTFIEITDEFGVHHRLDLEVLAKDDTWGAPAILLANVNEGSGRALFSQVHLEKNPCGGICFNLHKEQLERCNEWRLDILKDILASHLGMDVRVDANDEGSNPPPAVTAAFILGKHESKQRFLDEIKPHLSNGRLIRPSLTLEFKKENRQSSSLNETTCVLPVLLTGCPSTFSTVKYFEHLKTRKVGRVVLYTDVITSTMDVVAGSQPLGDGVVIFAAQQLKGKGRHGNLWLSPLGSAMWSLQLQFDVTSNIGQRLPFLQHIAALSVVLGVKTIPGYEEIPLSLKWPNDIYLGTSTKIGGVIVEASTYKGTAIANVGCGVNLDNAVPTSCINEAIRSYNNANGTRLKELTKEDFCASVFNQMERLLDDFEQSGPQSVIDQYCRQWLHGGAPVTVQNELGHREAAVVSGIDQYGFLTAVLSSGEAVTLHPDGNSFNMMEGLIYTKPAASTL